MKIKREVVPTNGIHRVYKVDKVEGAWLWLRSEVETLEKTIFGDKGVAGWVKATKSSAWMKRSIILAKRFVTIPRRAPSLIAEESGRIAKTSTRRSAITPKRFGSTQINRSPMFVEESRFFTRKSSTKQSPTTTKRFDSNRVSQIVTSSADSLGIPRRDTTKPLPIAPRRFVFGPANPVSMTFEPPLLDSKEISTRPSPTIPNSFALPRPTMRGI